MNINQMAAKSVLALMMIANVTCGMEATEEEQINTCPSRSNEEGSEYGIQPHGNFQDIHEFKKEMLRTLDDSLLSLHSNVYRNKNIKYNDMAIIDLQPVIEKIYHCRKYVNKIQALDGVESSFKKIVTGLDSLVHSEKTDRLLTLFIDLNQSFLKENSLDNRAVKIKCDEYIDYNTYNSKNQYLDNCILGTAVGALKAKDLKARLESIPSYNENYNSTKNHIDILEKIIARSINYCEELSSEMKQKDRNYNVFSYDLQQLDEWNNGRLALFNSLSLAVSNKALSLLKNSPELDTGFDQKKLWNTMPPLNTSRENMGDLIKDFINYFYFLSQNGKNYEKGFSKRMICFLEKSEESDRMRGMIAQHYELNHYNFLTLSEEDIRTIALNIIHDGDFDRDTQSRHLFILIKNTSISPEMFEKMAKENLDLESFIAPIENELRNCFRKNYNIMRKESLSIDTFPAYTKTNSSFEKSIIAPSKEIPVAEVPKIESKDFNDLKAISASQDQDFTVVKGLFESINTENFQQNIDGIYSDYALFCSLKKTMMNENIPLVLDQYRQLWRNHISKPDTTQPPEITTPEITELLINLPATLDAVLFPDDKEKDPDVLTSVEKLSNLKVSDFHKRIYEFYNFILSKIESKKVINGQLNDCKEAIEEVLNQPLLDQCENNLYCKKALKTLLAIP